MFSVGTQWNPLQARLRELIKNEGTFEEAMALTLCMHALLHTRGVSGAGEETVMDAVWDGLTEHGFRTMPTVKDVTVAWNVWHVTRIEDLTANLLIADGAQVLDEQWLKNLHTQVKDTGNAMTDPEILSFSREVDMPALREYRDAVGRRTRQILCGLSHRDLKRKFSKGQTERILAEGGVLDHPDSVWLLDFWGRKDVSGILLMPITRHQMGHLSDCLKLKAKCLRGGAKA